MFQPFRGSIQHGYVTNDLDRAKAVMSERYGITQFLDLRDYAVDIGGGREAVCSLGLAYLGDLFVEIIHPKGGECQVYSQILPADEFALKLHHHGYMVKADPAHDDAWGAMRQTYEARGIPIVVNGRNSRSGTQYFYADTRAELGHFCEHVLMTEQTLEDYAKIPQNLNGRA